MKLWFKSFFLIFSWFRFLVDLIVTKNQAVNVLERSYSDPDSIGVLIMAGLAVNLAVSGIICAVFF